MLDSRTQHERRELRGFAFGLICFCLIASAIGFWRMGWSAGVHGLAAVGIVVGISGWIWPKSIRPIFRAHCFDCHGATAELQAGLDLRLVRFQLKGGDSGAALVPGQPDESLLLQRIRAGEMPPGTVPQARHFPRRNRIISGLALATLVVEAAPRSGSLITARLAADQGREVMAVPGSPLDPRARGCNHLIRQGAVLVESADDVMEALSGPLRSPAAEPPAQDFRPGPPVEADESGLQMARAAIEELLGPTPVAVDEVIRQCQVSAAVVQTVLLELELAGRLERHPGNRVALVPGDPDLAG